jgi:hypothetical protein
MSSLASTTLSNRRIVIPEKHDSSSHDQVINKSRVKPNLSPQKAHVLDFLSVQADL